MKLLRPLIVGLVALTFFFVQSPRQSDALFHFAVIDEVMTSYNGDANVQFVEIKMLAGSQNFVMNSVLAKFDASGSYVSDLLVVPSNVSNSGNGVRWIMGTSEFQTASTLTPDFTFSAGLLTGGGMVCWGAPGVSPPPPGSWDHTNPNNYVDCVAYGTYSGPTNNHIGNPTPLTGVGHSLLRTTDTDDNLTDFICGDPATPRNNAGSTVSMAATTSCVPDDDGDGVDNDDDDCPGTAPLAPVDANGCSDAQVDYDADGICDPGAPSAGPSACQLSPADNCPVNANPLQEDLDADDVGDVCDVDDDGDLVSDMDEPACGTDPADGAESPERTGNGADEDGDTSIDETESAVSGADCDGDGYDDNIESALTWPPTGTNLPDESGSQCNNVSDDDADTIVNDGCPEPGTGYQERCSDASGANAEADDQWPADFNDSSNVNIQDVNSFNVPIKHFGASPLANHARWNLAGGTTINIQDVNNLGTLKPAMFNGGRAFGNTMWGAAGTCPAD